MSERGRGEGKGGRGAAGGGGMGETLSSPKVAGALGSARNRLLLLSSVPEST